MATGRGYLFPCKQGFHFWDMHIDPGNFLHGVFYFSPTARFVLFTSRVRATRGVGRGLGAPGLGRLAGQRDTTGSPVWLGPPVVPFGTPFVVRRVPLLKKTTEKMDTLILASLLEDLVGRLHSPCSTSRRPVCPQSCKAATCCQTWLALLPFGWLVFPFFTKLGLKFGVSLLPWSPDASC